ncbi:hypothetical protein [Paucihalobacter sp.]|uniref:hypothetical protein n=1 Tax=Paucihalobacter sp. TaxID=2850405 RepID=UPI003D1619AD
MNSHLIPTYRQPVNDHWILWFEAVNRYTIVDANFVVLLDIYIEASNRESFVENLNNAFDFDRETAMALEAKITHFLLEVNTKTKTPKHKKVNPKLVNLNKTATYNAFNIIFQVKAETPELLHLVNPPLEHLRTRTTKSAIKTIFYISEQGEQLHLFLNGVPIDSFPKASYHLLQGRFATLLLGALHNIEDSEWLASFHASTLAKNGKAIMLAGASGSGKSTLSALLAFQGFDFVSDDITGMLSSNLQVYSYPAALSVKSGAFEVLKIQVPQLESIDPALKHPKGLVKFLPAPQQSAKHYPCNQVVLVKYSQDPTPTQFGAIPTVKALEVLIPDTWISPKPAHAKAFLNWIRSLQAYELQYHNTPEAMEIIESLFKT